MNKTIATLSFFLLLLVSSCKKSGSNELPLPAELSQNQSALIANYPTTFLSVSDRIEINFKKPFSKTEDIGNTLSFQPHVKGKVSRSGYRKIIFTPEEKLNRGDTYKGSLDLSQLYENIEKNDQNFEFSFSVMKQYMTLNTSALKWDDAVEGTYKIDGNVSTQDVSEFENIKKCVSISPSNLSINWESESSGKYYAFTVSGIKRTDKEAEIVINYNGKFISADNDQRNKTIVVPAKGDFKIMETSIPKANTQNVKITFSELLDREQDLTGLISIKDYDGELTLEVKDNVINVYPRDKLIGNQLIYFEKGIKNQDGQTLKAKTNYTVSFANPNPAVELIGKGVICPNMQGVLFPFRAIKLRAVDLEIFKIYDDNILQFFQNGYYDSSYNNSQSSVGRIVLQTAVDLKQVNQQANANQWSTYGLDLSELIDLDPGAMYEVSISFRKEYAITECVDDASSEPLDLEVNSYDENKNYISFYNNYYGRGGYYSEFYQEKDNPCKEAYFNGSRVVRKYLYASNIGVIAKKGTAGNLFVACNDLVTTQPLGNIQLDIYDYQQQKIKSITTQSDGTAVSTTLDRAPFFIIANSGNQKGIVALNDGWSLSLSNFDVSGNISQSGTKGQFYTERGVWRPGDDIYLNFVLEDKLNTLPDNHPVKLSFTDPQGKVIQQVNTIQNVNGIYPFVLNTDAEAITGNYKATLTLGSAKFYKTLKVETVKPNRLKIIFDDVVSRLLAAQKNFKTNITVNWLVGTPAKNAKAKIEMQIKEGKRTFENQAGYHFYDETRKYQGDPKMIFDGTVNEKGSATVSTPMGENTNLPGMMKLSFQTKAFEPGGDFSIDNFSKPYSPFEYYTGIKLPKTEYGGERLNMNEENAINLISVDENGESVSGRKLTGAVYKLEWRWWWARQRRGLSQYNTSNYTKAHATFELDTRSEGATYNFRPDDWGRYLIRVCDESSGHCTSKICYAGYPYGSDEGTDFATMLTLSSDKEEYKTGEEVTLSFPSAEGGKALVSIENGADVLQTFWIDTEANKTNYSFTAGTSMAPTIYANVSYIQPQANVKNDLPIRMYGVIPISIFDPETKLEPIITTAENYAPEEPVSIQVSEKEGRGMTYTLAVVDEGLLDLTRFKTPDLWDKFYSREALGVKTWDLYDYVMGSMAGQLDRILSIGGDEDLDPKEKKNKANRFEPVVEHFGPFYLQPGNKKTHDFTMPNYIGSVRVMVVAAQDGAYGKAEATKPVKKPLMVLSSLPRVLSPSESMQLPISVFALETKIKNVKITVEEETGLVQFPSGNTKQISFSEIGEQMAYVDIKIPERLGVAKFNIVVESAGERATQQVEIQVDNPNEYKSVVEGSILSTGDTWTQNIKTIGMIGTNSAVLEVSNVPPLNLDNRLNYLLRYPHGCLEQTISAAFPQLYLDRFVKLTPKQLEDRVYYINKAIDKLGSFAQPNGSFSYWPGSYVNSWANIYAGHFLLEAQKLGFAVPQGTLNSWIAYQTSTANQYPNTFHKWRNNDLTQAYRLYTLSLAGHTQLGAMNRLRQKDNLGKQASWRLAASYAVDSRPEVAKEIIKKLSTTPTEVNTQLGYNFRSNLRDEGMILETLTLINSADETFKLLNSLSKSLSSNRFYNTQGLSYSLLAIGKYLSTRQSDSFSFQFDLAGRSEDFGSDKPVISIEVDPEKNKDKILSIKNTSSDDLFIRFISTGKPTIDDQVAVQEGIDMKVQYMDGEGKAIDITSVEQSQDIISKITIKSSASRAFSFENLALTQVLPSGWEIINDRMSDVDNKYVSSDFQHQDVRDDRIHTYFDLSGGATKIFYTRITATYQGNYYLPTQICKAMYDESIQATVPGKMIQIDKQTY